VRKVDFVAVNAVSEQIDDTDAELVERQLHVHGVHLATAGERCSVCV
jgi:hypothetical protein